jgi:hypothetical protein
MRCCPSGCATQCSPVFLEVAGPPITGPIRQSLPIQPIKSLYTKSNRFLCGSFKDSINLHLIF